MAPIAGHVLNDALSDFALRYPTGPAIADEICIPKNVEHLTGTYRDFGFDHWLIEDDGPLGVDQPYPEVSFDLDQKTFTVRNYGLFGVVSDLQEKSSDRWLNLAMERTAQIQDKTIRSKEKRCADLLFADSTYSTAHVKNHSSSKWTGNNDPMNHIEAAKEQVRKAIGLRPNAIAMSANVYSHLRRNEKVRSYLPDTRQKQLLGRAEIALAFDVPVENISVGDMVYNSAAKGKTRVNTDIWPDKCLVYYKPPRMDTMPTMAMAGEPCLAVNFRLAYPHMGGMRAMDPDVVEFWSPNPPGSAVLVRRVYGFNIVEKDAGCLLKNIV